MVDVVNAQVNTQDNIVNTANEASKEFDKLFAEKIVEFGMFQISSVMSEIKETIEEDIED